MTDISYLLCLVRETMGYLLGAACRFSLAGNERSIPVVKITNLGKAITSLKTKREGHSGRISSGMFCSKVCVMETGSPMKIIQKDG